MREFDFILQKRAYWWSFFTLLSILFVAATWKWGYQDVIKTRLSLSGNSLVFRQQEKSQMSATSVNNILNTTTMEVKQIMENFRLQTEVQTTDAIIPSVVKVLDGVSDKHGIRLETVTPLSPKSVLMLEERSFDITINGDYKSLFKWITEAESLLSPMVFNYFLLRPDVSDQSVEMRLRLVSFTLSGEK